MALARSAFPTVLALLLTAPAAPAADRALVVGITNYTNEYVIGPAACDTDAQHVAAFLHQKLDFPGEAIRLILNEEATYGEILKGFKEWLIDGTAPGDRVFFFFSGHGNQVPDRNGDEADGWDETLCPSDTSPFTPDRQITDDTIDTLVRLLPGRRVVLVFDCCHSGTDASAGGGAKEDLGESFLDPRGFDDLGGLVIISASASSQTAWAMLIDGKIHGGLSYALVESHRNGLPSVRELHARMAERISKYHASGRLGGGQEVSILAYPEALYDTSLFGTAKAERAPETRRPRGRLALEPVEGRAGARFGDRPAYRVVTQAPGHLYLLSFKPNNTVACLFPNPLDADNTVAAGSHAFPRSAGYAFQVVKPLGPELVAAVLSPQPLEICDKPSAPWSDVLWRLRSQELTEALGALPGTAMDQALVKTVAAGVPSNADVATLRVDTAP